MDHLCVIEEGCVRKGAESDRKTQLLAYLTEYCASFNAVHTTEIDYAVRTARLLAKETGLKFCVDSEISQSLNTRHGGWVRAQRGALNWLAERMTDYASGVIVVASSQQMGALIGAALHKTQGGQFDAEGYVQSWQEQGSVALLADIATQQLVDPIRGIHANLND